jgi:uncharacterized membrane protein YfcA
MAVIFILILILISKSDSLEDFFEDTNQAPLSNEIAAYIVIFFITALANSAGIGGGPLTTSVLIYIMFYEDKQAVALSQASILGGSLVAAMIKMTFKHPYKNGPLIDYNLVSFTCGCLIMGSLIGTLITTIAEGWMILLCLSIFLWIISYVTISKAIDLYKKETEVHNQNNEEHQENQVLLPNQNEPINNSWTPKIMIIISLFLLIIFSIIKGGNEFDSIIGIKQCSSEYFEIILGYFVIILLQTVLTAVYISNKNNNSEPAYNDFQLEGKAIIILPIITFITGLLSSSLGIGGGLVLNPVLILYGMLPEVSTASCNLFVFMASISSFIQFSMAGFIGFREGFLMFSVSVVGSCVGVFVIKKIIDHYKRTSLIVFLLGGLITFVSVIIPISLTLQIIQQINDGTFSFNLNSIC